jgi:hypothetical protein
MRRKMRFARKRDEERLDAPVQVSAVDMENAHLGFRLSALGSRL